MLCKCFRELSHEPCVLHIYCVASISTTCQRLKSVFSCRFGYNTNIPLTLLTKQSAAVDFCKAVKLPCGSATQVS